MVEARLVGLIPLVAGVHAIEILGLAWSVLVVPPISLCQAVTIPQPSVANSNTASGGRT